MTKLLKLCSLIALGMVVLNLAWAQKANAALTVVGNWEGGSGDNFFDWTDVLPVTDPGESARYSFSNTTGVTIGSSAIHLHISGNSQDLSIKLQNNPSDPVANHPDLRPAFFANRAVSFDVTYPAQNQSSGYQQLGEFDFNAQHFAYSSPLGAYPVPGTFVGYGNGMGGAVPTPDHTFTLTYNYASQLDVTGGPIITSGASADSYVEFIIDTNGDSLHPDWYFDNFRFYTPGDMNNDGHVNAGDIKAMQLALANPAVYKTTYFNGDANYVTSDLATLGDMNGDGTFTGADVQSLLNYLKTGHGSVSSVPEPASIVLLFLTIPAAFAGRKRLRKSR